MVDAFTRHSPAIEARFNRRGATVVDVLERVCQEVGYPRTIRVDQGPEFISRDLDDVCLDNLKRQKQRAHFAAGCR